MKRFLSLFALLLAVSMVLIPFASALASTDTSEQASPDDGEDVMTILSSEEDSSDDKANASDDEADGDLLTTGAESAEAAATAAAEDIDTSGMSVTFSVFDGEGNETRNFSGGTGCFSTGYTFYTDHDYKISYIYTDGSEKVKEAAIRVIDCDPEMQSKYLKVEGNTLSIKAGKENYSFKVALFENGAVTDKQMQINVARFKVEFTDILILGIGVYALATAITGTGAMFRNEFIKEGCEEKFKKYVRICSAVVGVCMLGVAAISIFLCGNEKAVYAKYALFGIAVAALIGSLVITSKMTDKEKKAKAYASGRTGGVSDSSAAFEFDEDEPTIDDVLAMKHDNKDE